MEHLSSENNTGDAGRDVEANIENSDRRRCIDRVSVRGVCTWIAQQFFGKILRELASDVWNLVNCALEDDDDNNAADEE